MTTLETTAQTLVANGRGILAADESNSTIEKRLKEIGVESTLDNRRAYRDLLFTTKGLGEFISGVILYDETIRQKASDGTSFVEVLKKNRIIPGIKVDAGTSNLPRFPGEKITEGLDGLRKRLTDYYALGARFAKWRAVITIGANIPSWTCIFANAHALGRYAALCQEANIVPIVEPEVLMDGDHTIERCYEVTEGMLKALFNELYQQRVSLEGTLLKASMVISGNKCSKQANVEQVAQQTIRCLKSTVPAAIPGIVFLSGGQNDELATAHLNAMNAIGNTPWPLSFSYGRALQQPALKAWRGAPANVPAAQRALHHRSKMNSLACSARYNAQLEKQAA